MSFVKKSAVIFGAGSIGRGFIGELMQLSDFEITFIDTNKELIDKLNLTKYYKLELVTSKKNIDKDIYIKEVIDGGDIKKVIKAIKDIDIIFTAVGQNALRHIAKPIALATKERKSCINIILCENMKDSDKIFSEMVLSHLENKNLIEVIGFIRASVGRMVPVAEAKSDMLVIKAEPYYRLPIDVDAIRGEMPSFVGCEKVAPFDYAIEKKLFIHNLGHVACAWLGYKKKYTYIYEAVSDIEIRCIAMNAMMQAAAALSMKYNKDIDDLHAGITDLMYRFENIALGDKISRVGRDTKRKLSRNDRVVGAYNLCKDLKLPNDAIEKVFYAGLEFENDDEGTRQMQIFIKKEGINEVLKKII